jgi:hypothetical protein
VYPGLRHETMNEPTGPAVVADVVAWLREQVPTAEAPTEVAPPAADAAPVGSV